MKSTLSAIARASAIIAVAASFSPDYAQNLTPEAKRLLEWSQSHKWLDWTGSGGCVVEFARTPCRTVRFHEYSFGRGLGFDGIMNIETTEAFDKDGSTATVSSVWKWAFWHLPEPTAKWSRITLRTQNREIDVDHDHAVFREYSGGAHSAMAAWEQDDQQCSHTKSHYLYLSERLPDSVVAGIGVVGYSGSDYGGTKYEVFFAPSLGCQQLRFLMWKQARFGLTIAKREMVVDSFELGPPSPTLFEVPNGYRRIEQ